MPKYTSEEKEAVKRLFDGKRGARSIAKELGITRHRVLCIYKELDIDNSNIKRQIKEIPTSKPCKTCNKEKPISSFRERIRNGNLYYEPYCKKCEAEYNKERCAKRYQDKGKKEFSDMYQDPDLKQKLLEENKKYREKNKDKLIAYRKTRADKDRENQRKWQSKKRKTDPSFRLRNYISSRIAVAIKKNGVSKNGSMLKYLPYSMDKLKEHLESLFEPWMTWENHGNYRVDTWDDNDPSTWAWQIDHIKPHSDFKYKTMNSDNFRECWALSNLRPLSAKQNLIDGTTRERHNVK